MDKIPSQRKYAYDQKSILTILSFACKTRTAAKIKYYSLSSDEVKFREVLIYYFNKDHIIAYCKLRKEIRTFVTKRIRAATILKEKYTVPQSFRDKDYVNGMW